ncbi:ABC transporter substrate-binding protein [Noviherbaspirillum pedocola]|uniref:ABC transporter substrate-binding protein n=1 Tax=Noviherbaspirillum pedocola TaxID=2801341 RepID=A0A934SZR8_9BURK|nr:ABC transporter substrate-binding protein [Noviherbaspirillum pedocola]MBK4738727.1 ABC transporter substrate-binding protein [Noviherbaspirillum pedocola]
MQTFIRNALAKVAVAAAIAGVVLSAQAQKKYDTGATDTEIKIGNFAPYSGPASAYGTVGKSAGAYFDKLNAEGGINGRKIRYISLDDAYSPPRAVEQARKLVEQEEVLVLFAPLGTASNTAIQKYMNAKKVPQLFVSSGAHRWGDYKNFPWTMGWNVSYHAEGQIYAQHILANKPQAKIGILFQNDEFGKDMLRGFLEGMGQKAKTMVVMQTSYELSDPTVDSQIVSLKGSGADTFVNLSTPKFAAQSIKKAADIGWKPVHYLANVSNSVTAVLKPAGLDNASGIISAAYVRDPAEARWQNSAEYKDYFDFMKKYYPDGDPANSLNVIGYSMAQTMAQVLKQAGDHLTRANIMKEAANLNMTLPMLYPGIDVKTGPQDFYPIEKMQMIRFNGSSYDTLGSVLGM